MVSEHAMVLGTLFALTVVLFLIVRRPRRELQSRSLTLLRCVFPAWRFFEEIADAPKLSHRVIDSTGTPGPWRQTLTTPRRHAGMWGLNATGNLYLAYQSLVEHFVADLAEDPENTDPRDSVSYQLVRALVEQHVRRELGDAQAGCATGHYQFRLIDADSPAPLWESQLHTLSLERA
jgi:hypothetical protein